MLAGAFLELLDPETLLRGDDFEAVEYFLRTSRHRHIGWHYIVDLAWIHSRARNWAPGGRILDVGGGAGPLQYLLAEMGFDVTNVDLSPPPPGAWIGKRYRASSAVLPSYRASAYVDHIDRQWKQVPWHRRLRTAARRSRFGDALAGAIASSHYDDWRKRRRIESPVGRISFVRANVCSVPELEDGTYDAVVSVSAVEHIPPDSLPAAVREMRRLMKPEARIAVTTSATDRESSWFHEPSQGMCYTPDDLSRLFSVPDRSTISASMVLERYLRNAYLKQHLPKFYFRSGDNGMPFGDWNPAYVPAGIGR